MPPQHGTFKQAERHRLQDIDVEGMAQQDLIYVRLMRIFILSECVIFPEANHVRRKSKRKSASSII